MTEVYICPFNIQYHPSILLRILLEPYPAPCPVVWKVVRGKDTRVEMGTRKRSPRGLRGGTTFPDWLMNQRSSGLTSVERHGRRSDSESKKQKQKKGTFLTLSSQVKRLPETLTLVSVHRWRTCHGREVDGGEGWREINTSPPTKTISVSDRRNSVIPFSLVTLSVLKDLSVSTLKRRKWVVVFVWNFNSQYKRKSKNHNFF